MTDPTAPPQLRGTVSVVAGPREVADAVAEEIVAGCAAAVAARGSFAIALTGGDSPRLLYEMLSADRFAQRLDWSAWRVYFGDERAVAPDHPDSNYRLVHELLLDHVPVPEAAVHRMAAERPDLDQAAEDYAQLLERTLSHGSGGAPRLDLVLLGLGENGHCASLFPGTPALDVTDRWATRGRADYAPYDRITLTFPTLNAARRVIFLVTGAAKAAAVRAVAAGEAPAARVQPPAASLHWVLDRTAAGG